MNTATQLGNAQPLAGNPLLQQGAAAATPQLAPSASEHGSPNPETLPFDAELQALLATLPGLQGGESAEGDAAAQAPSPAIPAPVEQGPEHAEALLGLLSAQQQQQVHAQQAPQASVSKTAAQAARVPETLPGLQTAVPPQAPADAALRNAQPLPAQSMPAQQLADGPGPVALRAESFMVLGSSEGAGPLESLHSAAAVRAPADAAPVPGAGAPAGAASERLLRLEGNDAQRGEQMMQALRNSVQLQVQQNQQVATIRLDPPELGSLEIQVSQESGRISIQISAAQADTLRLLQQTSDRLRHELLNQQFVQVSVQVGGEGHSGQQSRQNQGGSGEALVRGNPLQDSGDASSHAAPRDVLATV